MKKSIRKFHDIKKLKKLGYSYSEIGGFIHDVKDNYPALKNKDKKIFKR